MFAGRKKSVSIKSAAVFLAVLLIISFIAVIVDRNIRANTIHVNGKAMILGVGQEYDYPADDNLVHYKSYNKDVVTVDSNGVFRAVSKGSALVKVGTSEITVLLSLDVLNLCSKGVVGFHVGVLHFALFSLSVCTYSL